MSTMLKYALDNKYGNAAVMYIFFLVIFLMLLPLFFFKFMYSILYKFRNKFESNMTGKVVVITGASSGIGEHMAYEYAKKGAFLVIVARRESHLKQVAERARELGSPEVIYICADVSNMDDCKRFIDQTIHHFGRLDHLVNNAGVHVRYSIDDNDDVTKHAPIMDINFWGNIYPTYHAIPHLRKSKGKIVVNSSGAAYIPAPTIGFYSASKGALSSFYESLRFKLAPQIKVTLVILGFVESEIRQNDPAIAKGWTMMRTESCAKAIVEGACKGDRYVIEPKYIRPLIIISPLFPEITQWYSGRHFVPKLKPNSSTSSHLTSGTQSFQAQSQDKND